MSELSLTGESLLSLVEDQIISQTRRIDFYITEYTIEHLAGKMNNGDYEIPHYQRNFTWDKRRQSRFIESIFLNLPIPFLFLWENPETGLLEIVDGSQRLRTLREFVYGGLVLQDLELLDLLNDLKYEDLLVSRRRKFLNRSIRGIVLTETTDEQSRFDLFERLNTGSLSANFAEIRLGALSGPFMALVTELAASEPFVALTPMSAKQRKLREAEELITRFFAYGDGLEEYRDNVSTFLYSYTKKMNVVFAEDHSRAETYRSRFFDTMNFIERAFPQGFRRAPSGKASPRARFEAIAVGSYQALAVNPSLLEAIPETSWVMGSEFGKLVGGDGANAIGRLKNRIGYVRNKLLDVAE